jgi:hypothetical protein
MLQHLLDTEEPVQSVYLLAPVGYLEILLARGT